MMGSEFLKAERIPLKGDTERSERWVQDIIEKDPSILGIGDLVLRASEKKQPRAGRLDLLLQDPDTKQRYEVELQLGPTDETHIIRTIEYWDIERKRYPQYEHCAVIVAEDITSRFLNVISLFNGIIPLIAIQMQALRVGDRTTLVFTKVMDELSRGSVDEDEEAESAPTDREYWEDRATKSTVGLADQMLGILHGLDSAIKLKYNKFYIGLEKDRQPYNFVIFRPKKQHLVFEIKLPDSEEIDKKIDDAELSTLEYDKRWGAYRLRLTQAHIKGKADVLKELSKLAYDLKSGA